MLCYTRIRPLNLFAAVRKWKLWVHAMYIQSLGDVDDSDSDLICVLIDKDSCLLFYESVRNCFIYYATLGLGY